MGKAQNILIRLSLEPWTDEASSFRRSVLVIFIHVLESMLADWMKPVTSNTRELCEWWLSNTLPGRWRKYPLRSELDPDMQKVWPRKSSSNRKALTKAQYLPIMRKKTLNQPLFFFYRWWWLVDAQHCCKVGSLALQNICKCPMMVFVIHENY